MAWSDFPPRAPMRRVEGGIKARSTRGAIGSSWWSKRFLAVLESFALGTRLTRGKHYARAGQVLSLQITPGEVSATVQGSRVKPYAVRIGLATFRESVWGAVERRLASQALFSARLLAGELPGEIEAVFDAAGAPLFPQALRDLAMSCSCPDSAVPCKHLAATFYLLAEAFDDDPFQVLLWRGRPRETLLARLRTLRDGGEHSEERLGTDGPGEGDGRRRKIGPGDGDGRRGKAGPNDGDGRRGKAGPSDGDGPRRKVGSGDADGRRGKVGPGDGVGRRGKVGPGDGERGHRRSTVRDRDSHREQEMVGRGGASFGAAAALRDLPEPDVSGQLDRFWLPPVPLTGARQPVLAVERDLLLRQLPTPGPRLGGRALVDALRLLYKRFG